MQPTSPKSLTIGHLNLPQSDISRRTSVQIPQGKSLSLFYNTNFDQAGKKSKMISHTNLHNQIAPKTSVRIEINEVEKSPASKDTFLKQVLLKRDGHSPISKSKYPAY